MFYSDTLSGIYSEILLTVYLRHSFWTSFWHLFWNSLWHSILASVFWHSLWHFIWHCLWRPAEVPQCTEIWSLRLRSSSAHWALELAVGVRQCPLSSGARGWGLAVEVWQLRPGDARGDLEFAVRKEGRKEGRRRTIKSRGPYLAGGEKLQLSSSR